MLNIAFWNVNRRPIHSLLAALVKQEAVDLLVLAESKMSTDAVLAALNKESPGYSTRPWSVCTKIVVFTKLPVVFLQPKEESERVLICQLSLPARTEILLAMAHLPSKSNFDSMSQLAECQLLSEAIRRAETKVGHSRTVLVGDLNANPFEASVAGALGLHAVMTKNVALKGSRKVQHREYRFFYNPMWRHFGDRADGPPGTYYYSAAGHVTYFWNIFDQVLVRPDLIKSLPDDELRVLTAIGKLNLLAANGQPDHNLASDHLPLLFKLSI